MRKIILITGSTDGIGKLAAIKLAKEGHTIYMHGRNADKLNKLIDEIKTLSNNQNIDGFVADFSDLNELRKMASKVIEKCTKLDVLINNAGVFKSPISQNAEGLDLRHVVNYLAPYLLTKELIPLLENGINPRIINLSSAAQSSVSNEGLLGTVQLSTQEAYAQSKLALTMWSFHLAKQLEDIAVVAVNPGSLLNTKMVQEAYGRFWSSADKGATILYELSIDENIKNHTGKYFDNDQGNFGQAHADAYEVDKIKELIRLTENIISNA